jgi:hypothetical protein
MKSHLAFIGHPLMTKICKSYFAQNNLENLIDYYEASFGQLDPIITKFKHEKNIDAIITGWGHSSFLDDIGVPVVTINITGLDILEGLRRAKEIDNKVIFLKYGFELQIKQFAPLVGMKIISSSYTNRNDAITKIEKYFQKGYKTFICTSFPYEIVKQMGGNAIYIFKRLHY